MNSYAQGEVWYFDPDPIRGNELGKKIRPCLIISSNSFNKIKSGLVIIIPLTSVEKNIMSHVRIDPPDGGLREVNFAVCEQIRTISVGGLKNRIGVVRSSSTLNEIRTWIIDLTRLE